MCRRGSEEQLEGQLCVLSFSMLEMVEQVFRVKMNSCGAGAHLNSNYLLAISQCIMFSKSDSWGYSIVVGLKATLGCTRLLGLQEFQVSRGASHVGKAPLPNSQMFANYFLIYITF